VRLRLVWVLVVAVVLIGLAASGQDPGNSQKADDAKSEPKYDDTFSGPIVELTAVKITVSRSILGKPAEKRTFAIKPDTRIEGKLRVRAKVTVGFVVTDDGDVARLIVVRTTQRPEKK
jgi:hypothetical protein